MPAVTAPVPVLVVEDDRAVRLATTQTLSLAGFAAEAVDSAEAALRRLDPDWPGVVVSDVRMPGMDGLELHRRLAALDPDLPVVLITGHGDIAMAVAAMRAGAYDFIEKPFATEALAETVRRAAEKRRLVLENRELRSRLAAPEATGLVGRSAAIERLRRTVAAVADTDADVLIVGETGSGKEVVASALHRLSPRHTAPFVSLNCGALPESVVESELFGHEKGAFTGADRRRVGRIAHSSGGTLFLDEIESMPLGLQVKLLRVLQDRVVQPLGTNEAVPVDLRVVAAAKLDLAQEARAGRFRADLYYRLNVVTIPIPPLRNRREDVPLLFAHFVALAAERYRRPARRPEPELLQRLAAQDWPGNVRELKNAADRFVLDLDEPPPAEPLTLAEQVDRFEKSQIEAALAAHAGDLAAVLAQLGLPRKTLYDKLKRYGLARRDFE